MAGAVKMQVTMLMAVLVMMVATSVVTVDARLDFSQILDSFGIQTDSNVTPEDRGGSACCDLCLCTRSIPPQCRCADVKAYCYKGCKGCACTKSIPPQCRCGDIQNFCYKKCTTTENRSKEILNLARPSNNK